MGWNAQTGCFIRHGVPALDHLRDCFFLEFRRKPLGAQRTPSNAQRIGGFCLPDREQSNSLWHNVPKFVGSRVNVFLVAAFAQGGLPGHGYARNVQEQINANVNLSRSGLGECRNMALLAR